MRVTKEEVEQRDQLVKQKLLRCDDLGDLRVYSYVNKTQKWDDIILNSRGIILNRKTGEVVARAFPKFFNTNQTKETQEHNLPWKDGFRLFRKEDGWLGILYRHDNQHKIATRGSFKSIGAVWATEFLKKYDLTGLPDEVTLLFELICPATRIVVDYGNREDLILLGAYNRHTGVEYCWERVELWGRQFGFTLAESYDQTYLGYCRGQIKTIPGSELEGFIVRFTNGLRVKIKSKDYLRRSNLLADLTPLGVWDTMVTGLVPEVMWRVVDVDYHNELDRLAASLELEYMTLLLEIKKQFLSVLGKVSTVPNLSGRAAFANLVKEMKHQLAMFAIFDGNHRRVEEYIMKQIRPHKNVLKEN
ncbi:hypothetical protein LCGC14_0142940 [marine sediment metagenome]|uniref:T4 RNA ligase 1-like N-terminal domain-containing protein n=1 Tax=marine sediment metagenome TaxID=412755 RepID=A0A0F9V4X5_9ZZZZ